jgi:glutathione S-transferase
VYTLHYGPNRASMAAHISLRRTGAPFELVAVDLDRDEHKTPEFLRLNPSGRIPVLVHGEIVVSEAAAIALYLVDRHPALGPGIESPRRADLYRWLAYLSNTLQPALMTYFYPERHVRGVAARVELRDAAVRQIDSSFERIDSELSGGRFLLGPEPSVCDDYLWMLARWTRAFARPARSHPRIRGCLEGLAEQRPVREMLAVEHIQPPFF